MLSILAIALNAAITLQPAPNAQSEKVLAPMTEDAAWATVVDTTYLVPNGYSYSPTYTFGNQPAHVDAVRAELFVQRGDVCGAGTVSLEVMHQPNQTIGTVYYPDANGDFAMPDATIYKMVLMLYQPTYLRGRCIVRISVLPHEGGDDGDGDGDGFVLAGVLRYNGGFQDRLTAPVAGEKVKRFWARIPEFCSGVEILEGGVISEGHYERARLADAPKHIFEVNGGAGLRASEVTLTLNGPAGSACDIPMYVETAQ